MSRAGLLLLLLALLVVGPPARRPPLPRRHRWPSEPTVSPPPPPPPPPHPGVISEFNGTDPAFPFNVSFDITALTENDYTIRDSRSQFNLKYNFAFCRNVANPEATCRSRYTEAKTIYQLGFDMSNCLAAGGDWSNHMTVLVDAHDPSLGFMIQYYGGDGFACNGALRHTDINLMCDPKVYGLPDVGAVQEPGGCYYSITVRTIFACPTTCAKGNRDLCSGRGVCRHDQDVGYPHCFCNTGSWGTACQNLGVEVQIWNTLTYALIAAFVFLTIVLIIMVGIWMKVKKLKLDPTVYTTLKNAADSSTPYQKI